jgi:hypothetical protein
MATMMTPSRREISPSELEEIARLSARSELEKYVIPDEVRGNIALTTIFGSDERVFILYVPGERRGDARIIAKTYVDAHTGLARVEIANLQLKSL